MAAGTNVEGDEDIEEGTVSIIGIAQYGEILYANSDSSGVTKGELIAAFGTTYQWPFSAIVRMNGSSPT